MEVIPEMMPYEARPNHFFKPAPVDERLAFQLVRALIDGLPGDGR